MAPKYIWKAKFVSILKATEVLPKCPEQQPITSLLTPNLHEFEGAALSITGLSLSAVQNHFCFWTGAGWGFTNLFQSQQLLREVITYCTLISLQICFLLSEKLMRRNPPLWTRTTFRGARRPREAPYKVSPAKIQIFALKGGNLSVQKVENMIRVVTCATNIRFSWLFSKNFSRPGAVSSYTCVCANSWWSYHAESLSSSS